MTYRAREFQTYLLREKRASPNTLNTYRYTIGRIDRALGGLDEAIEARGSEDVLRWSRDTQDPPFDTYPSQVRSVLKQYLQFNLDEDVVGPDQGETFEESDTEAATGALFKLELEMQAAVRKQLDRLESGLVAVDGGRERSVSTGRFDILAKDKDGKYVVVEMKAGVCPPGALEQALGYAQALSDESQSDSEIRVFVVAAEFSDRTKAAARRIPQLELRSYEFSLHFKQVL